jgi:hypothetical protein
MKQLIPFLTFLISIQLVAQKIDWINAPENPIAIEHKLEHFNLKGDVYNYNSSLYFDKEGLLIKKSDYSGDNTYTYKNGVLVSDAASYSIKTTEKGYVTFKEVRYTIEEFTYNEKDLLISAVETRKASYNKPEVINTTKYEYDTQNRVIKEIKYTDGLVKKTTLFNYKKVENTVQVTKIITEANKDPYKNEYHYLNGRLVLVKDQYSETPLKIVIKLDAKGNSIEDKHISGEVLDTFKHTIVYHSDGNTTTNSSNNKEDSSSTTSKNVAQSENCISGDCINGYGEYKFSSGGGTFKGFFTNKTLNGYGTLDFANGDNYSGNFVDGKKNGFGIYSWSTSNTQYYGEWKNDKMHGYGYVVTNGETTQAGIYSDSKLITDLFIEYKNGKVTGDNCLGNCINGFGSFQYDNGDVYTGIFLNGNPSKTGSLRWKKHNSFYTGEFDAYGQINGTGMYVNTNYIYFGSITNGKLTGKAVKTDKITGIDTFGEFKDGILIKDYSIIGSNTTSNTTTTNNTPKETCISGDCINGYGKIKTQYGSTLRGFFTNGKLNGYGIEDFDSGLASYLGFFKNGLRNGYGVYYWDSSKITYYGQWKEGSQHGYGYYQKSSKVTEAGYYQNGKQTTNLLTQDFVNNIQKGNCIGNCTNGFGQYNFSDGSWYFGFFTDGKMAHVGAYKWASTGDIYLGSTNNDKLSGQGQLMYGVDKSTLCGEFYNFKLSGLGVYFDKSLNEISKGYWENGNFKTAY